MATEIYLDTARLGRMCHGARSAEQNFGWLVGQLGSSLYLERFLSRGFRSLPRKYRNRVPHLKCWAGVAGFRQALGRFIQQPKELPSYFFGQSTALIRFAAECLCARATRILITDLAWPPYVQVLRQVAKEKNAELCFVWLRDLVMSDGATKADVLTRLRNALQKHECDGVFLSDITFLGTTLPVQELLVELRDADRRPFVVVDGAQAFHQRRVVLSELNCDLYLAGTQKWFEAYHPLRIAFVGRDANMRAIRNMASHWSKTNSGDALYNFCRSMETEEFVSFGETVNVSALIAAAGALVQAQQQANAYCDHWRTLRSNAQSLADWIRNASWRAGTQHHSLRSGILILIPSKGCASGCCPHSKHALACGGIIASPFPDGSLRLSMPRTYLPLWQQTMILRALESCSAAIQL